MAELNLLAHLHLSYGCNPDTLTANVLADYLGRYDPVHKMAPEIESRLMPGISLHREIDQYTDTHSVFSEARNLISQKRRRLGGIIIDIVFDYYLTRHWERFSDESIDTVISRGYATIAMVASTTLSTHTQTLVSKMRATNWLAAYGTLEGQTLTFRRVSQRSPVVENLIGAEEEIVKNDKNLEDCFLRFYPELKSHIGSYAEEHNLYN